jgi:hypothetical protein
VMSESDRRRYAVIPEPIPRPCKRFSKRPTLNDRFLKHLPNCPACRATIEYFERQSQINEYVYQSRN